MNNADAWSSVEFYSSELTKFARQLGFAAAALCWLFREKSGELPIPASVALVLLVLFFVLDILQFFVSFHVHRRWMYQAEKEMLVEKKTLEGDYQKPKKRRWRHPLVDSSWLPPPQDGKAEVAWTMTA